jgi:hypothetical protein
MLRSIKPRLSMEDLELDHVLVTTQVLRLATLSTWWSGCLDSHQVIICLAMLWTFR